MTHADTASARLNGRAPDVSGLMAKVKDKVAWTPARRVQQMQRAPRMAIGPAGKRMHLATDRVRARPALSPTLSMNIGMTAVGLGLWGLFFPKHVARTLGVDAPPAVVQAAFGLRELWTGVTLAADPTKASMLWTRVAGDAFDIALLRSLDNRSNPQRGAARAALGFVLAVTALDVVTAIRMTNVQRNCG